MTRVLAVDDEPFNLLMIEEYLDAEYDFVTAGDGGAAWTLLDSAPQEFDLVILDRIMPGIDGLETLRRIRADPRFRTMPVIMQTAACSPAEVAEGLALGAWYYLAKPYDGAALASIVRSALQDRARRLETDRFDSDLGEVLAITHGAVYRFRTPAQARLLATQLARLRPDQQALPMGLLELLLNAVEHGNLGLSYADKGALLAQGCWHEEIERRLGVAEWSTRQAQLEFAREGDILRFRLVDSGAGFDWRRYLAMDPSRAFDPHGRGIAMARMLAFADLEYQGTGNTVVFSVC
jgi:CheY-like chemotaxis protein